MNRIVALVVLALALCALPVLARVERVEVTWSGTVLNGKAFGETGAYEALQGKIYYAVDPDDDANSEIADLDLAPRNADGDVEFSADFYLLWPLDPTKGNGTMLCEVVNRGNKLALPFFQGAQRTHDPRLAADFGDGFLMNQGYSLLWVGWQFDVPDGEDRLRAYVPVARNVDRTPIRGLVRSEILATDRVLSHSLADRDHKAYPVADPDDEQNVLTVRDSREGTRRVIPRSQWRFARMEDGMVKADPTRVYLEGGFDPHRIYEVVYVAENPPVAGLGMVALRDAAAYVKHADEALFGVQDYRFEHAIAFGVSQSGRLLRTLLYHGLNQDEERNRAFDGMLIHVAGGGRGSFNVRFAQPSRDGHPFRNHFYPTDIYPFSDRAQADAETGLEEGILSRLTEQDEELLPRVFYTNSSYEYWGRAASQMHTTLDGRKDVTPSATTRIYLLAGGQHGPQAWPPTQTEGQQLANPNDYRPAMRALLGHLLRWVKDDVAPPESRIPTMKARSLIPPEGLRWPAIPNAPLVTRIQKAYRVDYGPKFWRDGIIDQEPPVLGKEFPLLVPQVNADGNEMAGVHTVELLAPLATYTGWNPFRANTGPTRELSSMVGSFIPFARTKQEATANSDPRKPVDARYRNRDDYQRQARGAAARLVGDGFLLAEDVDAAVKRAMRTWDWLMGDTGGAAAEGQ
ncbi:MAG: hypothetical protein MUF01_16175 [Bryobacterales bacterium]|nr:hypothetical protein [Bryobacterales bacterium]